VCSDIVKPSAARPTVQAVEEGLSRPQAEEATCDVDTEMACSGDETLCVPFDQLCDGQTQCPNGDDEDPYNCAYYNGKFSHSLSMLAFILLHADRLVVLTNIACNCD